MLLAVVAASGVWFGGAWGADGTIETYEVISYDPVCTAMRMDDRDSITRLDTIREYTPKEIGSGLPIRMQVSSDAADETIRWLLDMRNSYDRLVTVSVRNLDNSTTITNPDAKFFNNEVCYPGLDSEFHLRMLFIQRDAQRAFAENIGAAVGAADTIGAADIVDKPTSKSDLRDLRKVDGSGRVYLPRSTGYTDVNVEVSGSTDSIIQYLENNGAFIYADGCDRSCYIRTTVPTLLLGRLALQDDVTRIRPYIAPIPAGGFGPTATDGLTTNLEKWHAQGHDGSGIKIGVIDSGFLGLQNSINNNELPANLTCSRGPNITNCEYNNYHGTNVAEILMDMAPGAELYLGLIGMGASVFDTAVWMVDRGVDIIVYSGSLIPFEGPGNGDSYVNDGHLAAIKNATDSGVMWINAAGNANRKIWYDDTPHIKQVNGKKLFIFSPDSVGDVYNKVYLSTTVTEYIFVLRWDGVWDGTKKIADLRLWANHTISDYGPQISYTTPTEPHRLVRFTVEQNGTYNLSIEIADGAVPGWVQLYVASKEIPPMTDSGQWTSGHQMGSNSYSLLNNAESNAALHFAVGGRSSLSGSLMVDSSRGPRVGDVLPEDSKPEFNLIGNTKTSRGQFAGTSAAAPHAAGRIASIWSSLDPNSDSHTAVGYIKANITNTGQDNLAVASLHKPTDGGNPPNFGLWRASDETIHMGRDTSYGLLVYDDSKRLTIHATSSNPSVVTVTPSPNSAMEMRSSNLEKYWSGLLNLAPQKPGESIITITIHDGSNDFVIKRTITVKNNHHPEIVKPFLEPFVFGKSSIATINANDKDGDTLSYNVELKPDEDKITASIDKNTGRLEVSATKTITKIHRWDGNAAYASAILPSVWDGKGGYDFVVLATCVARTNSSPDQTKVPDQMVFHGQDLTIQVNATDRNGDRIAFANPFSHKQDIAVASIIRDESVLYRPLSIGDITEIEVESARISEDGTISAVLSSLDSYGNTILYEIDADDPIPDVPIAVVPASDNDGCPPRYNDITAKTSMMHITGLSVGDATIRLSATDGWGGVSTQNITVTVLPSNDPPVADAGMNQTTHIGSIVTLDGSASADPEDDPLSYLWRQTSGSAVTLSNSTITNPSFVAPDSAGMLVFELAVSDGYQSHTDTVTIRVVDGSPTADAGADQTTYRAHTVTLNGSASYDPDNDVLSYVWRQTVGSVVALSNHTMPSPSFTTPNTVGTLTFELTVFDGKYASTDTVVINVVNRPPASDAGADQTAYRAHTMTLDGSASYDLDNDILSYTWSQTSGTTVTLSDYMMSNPTFTAPDDIGALVFDLIVSDGMDDSVDVVTISVVNRPPIADAGQNQTVRFGDKTTLNGSASYDPDNDILSYMWNQTSGPTVMLSDHMAPNPTFVAPDSIATMIFEVIVSDGFDTDTDTVTILVVPPNKPPTADAGINQTVGLGGTVTLNGSASYDPDNDAISYIWSQMSGAMVVLSDDTAESPTFVAPGNATVITFEIIVSDGEYSNADIVTIHVVNQPPISDAGADQTTYRSHTITLNGSASYDPDHHTISYVWHQTSGHIVTLYNSTTPNPTFITPNDITVMSFELIVSDGEYSNADMVTIHVVNQPPVADAGPDHTLQSGERVTLSGAASTDPDGDILTYWWSVPIGQPDILSDVNGPTVIVTAPTGPALLAVQLIVSDGWDSIQDLVVIDVLKPPNRPPVSDAGADQTVGYGKTVTLDGSASYDQDGDMISYIWNQTSGVMVSLSDDMVQNPTFTTPNSTATITFELTASDRRLSHTDTVTITVVNRPPVSDAGADQTVGYGKTVTLDGSASDPDGDQTSHTWKQVSGPAATLSDSMILSPSFVAPESAATMTFEITVSDGHDTDADMVTITVVNNPPVADAGADQTVGYGDTVTMGGSASYDQDSDSLSYAWNQTTGPAVALSDYAIPNPTFTAPDSAGMLTFELTVSDGYDADTDTVTIVIMNRPPVADAGADQTVGYGDTVTMDGSASYDQDGDSLSYVWKETSETGAKLSDTTIANPTFTAPGSAATITFELTVSDGELSSTGMVTITVKQPNRAPTADAGADQAAKVGEKVTLSGAASTDPDGDTLTYTWSVIVGPPDILSGASGSSVTVTVPDGVSVLGIYLTVSDGEFTSRDLVLVMVG